MGLIPGIGQSISSLTRERRAGCVNLESVRAEDGMSAWNQAPVVLLVLLKKIVVEQLLLVLVCLLGMPLTPILF